MNEERSRESQSKYMHIYGGDIGWLCTCKRAREKENEENPFDGKDRKRWQARTQGRQYKGSNDEPKTQKDGGIQENSMHALHR